jgi:xylose dehydrogenase (NAD/NADP)
MKATLDDYFDGFTRRDWQTLPPEDVDEPIRLAVVGLGWFAQQWALPGIRESAFTEATVVTDIDADAVATVADEHDLTGLSPDEFEGGEAVDAYDAVYVATPNATHLEYVEAAAAQGKAVLCEKPLEATAERAERLVAACETAGVPLMTGYRMQTEPAVRRVRELLQAGFVGDVVHVHANMSQTMLGELTDATDQWRLDSELSGGCALMDLGVYPLNTIRFVLESDPVRVVGHTRSEHEAFDEVDEHVSFGLTFPDGVQAQCTASQNAQHASRLEILGTAGKLVLDPAFYEREDRELTIVRGGMEADVEFEQVNQLEEEFAYFGHHLLTGTALHPDGQHALTDMRVLDAVYESAATGEAVEVGK